MALSFTESTTNKVDFGSATSVDNIATGTIIMWLRPDNLTLSFREIAGKLNASTGSGINLFRKGADGNYRLAVNRATSNQLVDLPVGSLTANAENFCAFTWDTASGGPKTYHGTLSAAASDVTTGATDGSGAKEDDSTYSWMIGDADPSFTGVCMGMDVSFFMLLNTDLPLAQIQAIQFATRNRENCVNLMHLGFNGTGTQIDYSGNGNDGTVTGAVAADHAPLPPPFGFDDDFDDIVAAVTDTTITPGVATLTLTENIPVIALGIIPGVVNLAITENIPQANLTVTPGVASLTLSEFAPTITAPVTVTPGVVALTTTGFAPSINVGTSITPGVASLTTATFAPSIVAPVTVTPGVATLTLSAFAPSVNVDLTVTPGVASLATTGFAPSSEIDVVITPTTIALTLALLAPSITATTDTWVRLRQIESLGDGRRITALGDARQIDSIGDRRRIDRLE